ncbi:MAG: SpoIIE family protein phosphatase [Erysipelotrichaceae bacterium]|nr:SpoIIE family protein phosphatase [Erysipelotrichaceae bacterium]
MARGKRKYSLLLQIALLFTIIALMAGVATFAFQSRRSDELVREQVEAHAESVAREVTTAVTEYPAHEWLLRYWCSHFAELSIEYDALFEETAQTAQKAKIFTERHPDLAMRYLTEEQLEKLPPEDQKLYAEIAYSWMITRMDQIKESYDVDYLFCVLTEEPYQRQFFLFSAGEPGCTRGTKYEEVYTLGTTVSVTPEQAEAMRSAEANSSYLANAGNYMDYYTHLMSFDGHAILTGLTFNLSGLNKHIESTTWKGVGFGVGLLAAMAAIFLLVIWKQVLQPLREVQEGIRQYKIKKDSKEIADKLDKIRSDNELGVLSEDVVDLTVEMDDYMNEIRKISAEKERIGVELDLANKIQSAMLPSAEAAFPGRTEFDLYAMVDPAKTVAGDFYDFFLIDEDHLCLVIADVSGKGIPASLFMMVSKIILQSCAMLGRSAEEILQKTNEAICSKNAEMMFVSVWLGIVELSTGRLTAANAGHEYPCFRHASGDYEMMKDRHGLVLGAMEESVYHSYEVQLQPGDSLFVYTDGVPEATDSNNQLFGNDRLMEALNRDPAADTRKIISSVADAVSVFVGDADQFDDITMLAFRYNGATNMKEITVEAKIDNVGPVTDFIDEQLEKLDCPFKARTQIDVAIDEIFSNIAKYAYPQGNGKATVRFEPQSDPRGACIWFIDEGIPYDPLSAETPDVSLPAEERDVGGLGIFLVRKTMDDVRYEYKDGKNILCLHKRF